MSPGKRALDLAVAAPLSVAIIPLVGLVAVLNRLSGDRGPVLYRARRVGESGRVFSVLKLRTMGVGEGSPLTTADDPRVTRLGRVLRELKVDELPQLWNVLRGEMSLVGPRPEDPQFVDWTDPLHRLVFMQRPGITGLAQVVYADESTRHDPTDPIGSYRARILSDKLALDRRYLESQSLRLDARILLATARLVLRRAIALVTRYAGSR